MILDVGCGSVAHGDVNCDLYKRWTPQADLKKLIRIEHGAAFIQCDAQHLPFRSKIFDEVYCSHVIEHLPSAFMGLRELIRVCRGKLTIKVPHRFGYNAKNRYHRTYFNQKRLQQIFKNFDVEIWVSKRRNFPHSYLHIVEFPQEITVTVNLRQKLIPLGVLV